MAPIHYALIFFIILAAIGGILIGIHKSYNKEKQEKKKKTQSAGIGMLTAGIFLIILSLYFMFRKK